MKKKKSRNRKQAEGAQSGYPQVPGQNPPRGGKSVMGPFPPGRKRVHPILKQNEFPSPGSPSPYPLPATARLRPKRREVTGKSKAFQYILPSPPPPEGGKSEEEVRREAILKEEKEYARRILEARRKVEERARQKLETDLHRAPAPKMRFKGAMEVSAYILKHWSDLFTPTEQAGWAFHLKQRAAPGKARVSRQPLTTALIPPRIFLPGSRPVAVALASNVLSYEAGFGVPRTKAPTHLSTPAAPFVETFEWTPQGGILLRWITPPILSYGPQIRGSTLIHFFFSSAMQNRVIRVVSAPYPQCEYLFYDLWVPPAVLRCLWPFLPSGRRSGSGGSSPRRRIQKGAFIPLKDIPKGRLRVQLEFVIAEGEEVGALPSAASEIALLTFPYQGIGKSRSR